MFRKAADVVFKDKNSQKVNSKDEIHEDSHGTLSAQQETTSNDCSEDNEHITPANIRILMKPEALKKGYVKNRLYPQIELQENQNDTSSPATQLVDISFSYNKENHVLKGVNMTVKKGQIYALLGPSGCGKTTLLKCVTQTLKPQSGTVLISQKAAKDAKHLIGFMPQELALFPELTIDETFWLFGRIYGIPGSELLELIQNFSKIFELPPRIRRIEQLSGGQKRRVSFISALLRDAPLLILDEPTVGLDPVLRQTIWNYLVNYTSSTNKTVLLTTHYIDEAKDATMIGLMRDGQVLVEASPSNLMTDFNETSLERCFYKICVESQNASGGPGNQESDNLLVANSRGDNKSVNLADMKHCTPDVAEKTKLPAKRLRIKSSRTFRNISCLVDKNIKLLKRTAITVAMQFIIPGVVIALFGICIGDDVSGLKAAIVNEEEPPYLSKTILTELDTFSVIQRYYSTLADGITSVKNGENLLAIHFQPDFSYCLLHRLNLGVFVNNATLECSSMKMYMDTTNQILSLNAQNYIIKSYFRVQQDILVNLGASPLVGNLPVEFQEPIHGSLDMKFKDYVIPTALLLVVHYLAAALAGINLILERANGVFERLQVVGVTKVHIFAAQIFTSCLVVIIQIIIMLIVQFSIFNTDVKGNLFYAIIIILLQGLSGILFGFFISSITKNINVGLMIGMGAMYPNIVLCGFIWPLEGMPIIMRKIANFVPLTLTVNALRSVILRGWGISHYAVCIGLLSVVGWSAIFLITGMLFYKFKK